MMNTDLSLISKLYKCHDGKLYSIVPENCNVLATNTITVDGVMLSPVTRLLNSDEKLRIPEILWMLVYGVIPGASTVDYVDPDKGDIIDNLCLRDKESSNVLSESTVTGLSGIMFDVSNSAYFYLRNGKMVLDSVNKDWRITLNYRLSKLTRWLRPAAPFANTPADVWEYISKVPQGMRSGAIEDNIPTVTSTVTVIDEPKVALFYTDKEEDLNVCIKP
jgi:hypothetical protein